MQLINDIITNFQIMYQDILEIYKKDGPDAWNVIANIMHIKNEHIGQLHSMHLDHLFINF